QFPYLLAGIFQQLLMDFFFVGGGVSQGDFLWRSNRALFSLYKIILIILSKCTDYIHPLVLAHKIGHH
ncbi:hypothetical protein A9Q81_23075, partial [Gammaproteobacteria bacterium 42_54_T18]